MSGCCVETPAPGGDGGNGESALGLENYHRSLDTTVFSTSSNVFVSTGKSLVTPVIPAGDYRFGIHYQCRCTTLGEGHWRVRLDGITTVWTANHVQDWGITDDDFSPAYRSRIVTLTNAAHTFLLETREIGGETTTTRDTYFELWRVPPTAGGDKIDPCICEDQQEEDTHNLTTTPIFDRAFRVSVPSGIYRVEVTIPYRRNSGSAFDYNMQLDGVDLWAVDFRERPPSTGVNNVRQLVREVDLSGGMHTFRLKLSSSSTTTVILNHTNWYLHRIADLP